MKPLNLVNRIPGAITDAHHFVHELNGPHIDDALPALANDFETEVAIRNNASDQGWGEFHDSMPSQSHDVSFSLPGGADKNDRPRFEKASDIGDGKILLCVLLHCHSVRSSVAFKGYDVGTFSII